MWCSWTSASPTWTASRRHAASAAVLIVAAAALVGWLGAGRPGSGPRLMSTALIVLVVLGALATWNPWSNDWLFVSVRPVAARGGPMPLPTAERIYESPDLGALPPGPYVETIEEITVARGVAMDAGSTGAAVLLVLDGRIEVQPAGEPSIQVSNAGDRPARLLKFAVMPAPITDPSSVVVPATANIFGAGHDTAPSPGGGGGGTVPPVWQRPSGAMGLFASHGSALAVPTLEIAGAVLALPVLAVVSSWLSGEASTLGWMIFGSS